MNLQAAFDYRMSGEEIETYQIAIQYEEEFMKLFRGEVDGQSYRRNRLPVRNDPRKSVLFRHCWALRRETRGLLKPEQYRQFIHANLAVLKLNHAQPEPTAIRGDKAWIRWKVWERWYRKKQEEMDATLPKHSFAADPKIMKEIDKSKRFIFEQCEGEPTEAKIQAFIESGMFRVWVMMGKVSPFYITLSPFVGEKSEELATSCSQDPVLLRERTTDDVCAYFREEFKHEF